MPSQRGLVRIVAATATAALVAGIGTIATPAGAQPQSVVLDCRAKDYRILFWSGGHGAVPSVGFPEYPVPHVEVYVGKGMQYPNEQMVGFTDSAGSESHSEVCTTGTTAPKPGTIRKAKVTRDAATLVCKLPKKGVAEIVPGAGTSTVRLFQSGKPVAEATVGRLASLRYNKTVCKAGEPPS